MGRGSVFLPAANTVVSAFDAAVAGNAATVTAQAATIATHVATIATRDATIVTLQATNNALQAQVDAAAPILDLLPAMQEFYTQPAVPYFDAAKTRDPTMEIALGTTPAASRVSEFNALVF
jgi:hypothetical protein